MEAPFDTRLIVVKLNEAKLLIGEAKYWIAQQWQWWDL